MKSTFSHFIDQSKIKSNYINKSINKPKQKSTVSFIAPEKKLKDIFGKNQVIEKQQSFKKKHAQKKKNMTCINLGVDEDYSDITTSQTNMNEQKPKYKQIIVRQQRKRNLNQSQKKASFHKSYKNIHQKTQSQNEHLFSFLEPNKEKENLIQFEKKLLTNLVKKKDERTSVKSNFNETFKYFYDSNMRNTKKELNQPTLSIKKSSIYEQQTQINYNKEQQEQKKTTTKSNVSIHRQKNKHQLNIQRYKPSKQKQQPLTYKKLSQSNLRHNMTDMLFLQNEIQQQISLNDQSIDPVRIHNNIQQHKSSPNILLKNQNVKQRNLSIEKNKLKAVDQNLKFKKYDLQKLQSAIHRSANVSTYKKFVPYRKNINRTYQKPQLNQRGFLKCRNTCPITQKNQSIFTPWDYLPTQRQILDLD